MITWFKKLLQIVREYDEDKHNVEDKIISCNNQIYQHECVLGEHRRTINEAQQLIKDRTEVHADIHHYRPNDSKIIVIGQYKGQDYIQIFPVGGDCFGSVVDRLRHESKYAKLGRFDGGMPNMKASIIHEIGEF